MFHDFCHDMIQGDFTRWIKGSYLVDISQLSNLDFKNPSTQIGVFSEDCPESEGDGRKRKKLTTQAMRNGEDTPAAPRQGNPHCKQGAPARLSCAAAGHVFPRFQVTDAQGSFAPNANVTMEKRPGIAVKELIEVYDNATFDMVIRTNRFLILRAARYAVWVKGGGQPGPMKLPCLSTPDTFESMGLKEHHAMGLLMVKAAKRMRKAYENLEAERIAQSNAMLASPSPADPWGSVGLHNFMNWA
jgi:hypothetical protein